MNKIAIARLVSIVGHPFTFIVLLLLVPFWRRGDLAALRIAGIVVVAGLVPLGIFCRHRFTSGRWSTVDASDRRERPALFLAALTVLLPMSLYFFAVERSPILVRGCLAIGVMIAVGAAVNRWLKGSGHMAFASLSAMVLRGSHPILSLAITLFLPLLAWSRVKLLRHTIPEVIGGLVLGLVTGAVLLWL